MAFCLSFRMFVRCPKFKAHVMIKLKCIGTTKAKMNVSLLIGVSKDDEANEARNRYYGPFWEPISLTKSSLPC